MQRRDEATLRDMLDAARSAIAHAAKHTRADLDADDLVAHGFERFVEIIGEAARNVSAETRALAPEIPWEQVVGSRHVLAHEYFRVNLNLVWNTVLVDLPPLVAALEKALARLAPAASASDAPPADRRPAG